MTNENLQRDKVWDILVCFGENYGDVKLEDTDRYVSQCIKKLELALTTKQDKCDCHDFINGMCANCGKIIETKPQEPEEENV